MTKVKTKTNINDYNRQQPLYHRLRRTDTQGMWHSKTCLRVLNPPVYSNICEKACNQNKLLLSFKNDFTHQICTKIDKTANIEIKDTKHDCTWIKTL